MNHKAISLTSASKSSTCGRVNRTIDSTAIRFFFLTQSRERNFPLSLDLKLPSLHAVAQCKNKYNIIQFPTALRPISQLVKQYFISGGIVLFSAIKSSSMRAFLLQSSQPVEYTKTASLLQVTHSFKQSSQALNQH